MILIVAVGVLLLNACNDAAPTRVQRMTISKMRMSDLETSASGYVYNQQQGLPVSYVQYTNHGSGRYYHAPDTVHYVVGAPAPVASAVPKTAPRYEPTIVSYASAGSVPHAEKQSYGNEEIANYGNEQLPKYVPLLGSVKSEPRAPYYAENVDEKEKTEVDEASDENEDDEDDGDDDDDEEYQEDEEDEDEGDDVHTNFHVPEKKFDFGRSYSPEKGVGFIFPVKGFEGFGGPREGANSAFEAGGGEKHGEGEYSERGEKGDEGYEKEREFSKGEQARHDSSNQKGYYDIEGGNKKENIDAASKYGSTKEEEQNKKDSNYGHLSYHKKGQKTSGFHNMYHKDEYKKTTDFYDDDHKQGHFDKYEEFQKQHKAADGGFKKGGRHSSGFDQGNRGEKGYYNKGHHQSHDQGHEADEKEKSYHGNHADYAIQKGSNSARKHKFSTDSDRR